MKAILIDSEKRELREVEYDHGSKPGAVTLQMLIGGYIESAWSWENGDVLWVDEEGLFKPQSHFFRFTPRGDGQPLAGNGVLIGREEEDDSPDGYHTEPPTITIEELRPLVQFLTREQAEAWAKGNASEPAVTVYFPGEDGTTEATVIERYGHLFDQMPKREGEA